jgi:hypothetical protein
VEKQVEVEPDTGAFECALDALRDAVAIAGTVVSDKERHPAKRSVLLEAREKGGFVATATDLVTTAEVRFASRAQAGTASATGGALLIDFADLKGALADAVRGVSAARRRTLRVRIEAVGPLKAKLTVGDFSADLTCFPAARDAARGVNYSPRHYPAPPAILREIAEVSRDLVAGVVGTVAKVAKAPADRPELSCVSIAVRPGVVTVLGGDGGQLDVHTAAAGTHALGWERQLLVEGRPLAAALKRGGDDWVVIGADAHGASSFTCGHVTLTSEPDGWTRSHYPLAGCQRVLDVLPVARVVPSRSALLTEVRVARGMAQALTGGDLVELRPGQDGVRVVPSLTMRASEADAPLVAATYEGPADGLRRVFSGKRLERALEAFDADAIVLWVQRPSAGLLLAEPGRLPWEVVGHRHLLEGAHTLAHWADAALLEAEQAAARAADLAPEASWPRARAQLERDARRAAEPLLRDGRATMAALRAACQVMYAGYDRRTGGVRGLGLSEMRRLLAPGARSSTARW